MRFLLCESKLLNGGRAACGYGLVVLVALVGGVCFCEGVGQALDDLVVALLWRGGLA